jgi:hypothetical protein
MLMRRPVYPALRRDLSKRVKVGKEIAMVDHWLDCFNHRLKNKSMIGTVQ